jgi:hypothetical protein
MAAARPHPRNRIPIALLWASLGGGLIGALIVALFEMLEGPAFAEDRLASLASTAILLSVFSQILVLPCTLAFGIPSALLADHLKLGKWSVLALITAFAIAAQMACLWLLSSGDPPTWRIVEATTPFALSAALVLWWRLTRTA